MEKEIKKSFKFKVNLEKATVQSGAVQLQPGIYDVKITSFSAKELTGGNVVLNYTATALASAGEQEGHVAYGREFVFANSDYKNPSEKFQGWVKQLYLLVGVAIPSGELTIDTDEIGNLMKNHSFFTVKVKIGKDYTNKNNELVKGGAEIAYFVNEETSSMMDVPVAKPIVTTENDPLLDINDEEESAEKLANKLGFEIIKAPKVANTPKPKKAKAAEVKQEVKPVEEDEEVVTTTPTTAVVTKTSSDDELDALFDID